LTVANGWADQADVLIRTRQAADAVGATRCHRPEWVTENSATQDVYVTFTNGTGNNSAVNSNRDPNPYGHIVRLRETGGDHRLVNFDWSIFLLAGDNQYDPLVPATQPLFRCWLSWHICARRQTLTPVALSSWANRSVALQRLRPQQPNPMGLSQQSTLLAEVVATQ
jgi:hypothetical protein